MASYWAAQLSRPTRSQTAVSICAAPRTHVPHLPLLPIQRLSQGAQCFRTYFTRVPDILTPADATTSSLFQRKVCTVCSRVFRGNWGISRPDLSSHSQKETDGTVHLPQTSVKQPAQLCSQLVAFQMNCPTPFRPHLPGPGLLTWWMSKSSTRISMQLERKRFHAGGRKPACRP